MRATPYEVGRDETGWIYEPHYEGRRCVAVREDATLRFLEDGWRPTANLETIADVLRSSPSRRFAVDGTIVRIDASDERAAPRPRRPRVPRARDLQPHYYVFDLLQLEGRDTTSLRLIDRKALLRSALRFEPPVHYVAHRTAVGEFVRRVAHREGWSGVVAKRADSVYAGGPSRDWQTWRTPRRGSFLLAGYVDEEHVRLVLAAPGHDGLHFVGFVELPPTERSALSELVVLSRGSSPLVESRVPGAPAVRWLAPERVCDVDFTAWASGGTFLAAAFAGWRSHGAETELTPHPGRRRGASAGQAGKAREGR